MIVIGAIAVLHVLVNVPVVLGDVMTFYAMFCAIAYGPRWCTASAAAGMLGVLVQAASGRSRCARSTAAHSRR